MALAQRWQVNPDAVQAVKEVLAKSAGRHRLFERLVRSRDHAHIRVNRGIASHPLESSRLQHAQDLGLRRGRHVPNLVEEDNATSAMLEFSDALVDRARKGAAFVAEELTFEQLLGNGRAIHRQERFVVALARSEDHTSELQSHSFISYACC